MSGKVLYRLMISAILVGLLVTGCANKDSGKGVEVTFGQLFSNPSQYSGKNIVIEGFIFLGFEIMVLSEELKYSGYAEGHLIPSGEMLWIEGGIPTIIYDELYEQNMMGPSERYSKVRMTGRFEHSGKYGHLGGYDQQITPTETKILPWSLTTPETSDGLRFAFRHTIILSLPIVK